MQPLRLVLFCETAAQAWAPYRDSAGERCCRHLALSSNNIDKIAGLSGLDNLKILSLGRNLLKKIENVEPVANTLQQLWVSYNLIEKLVRQCVILHESTMQPF